MTTTPASGSPVSLSRITPLTVCASAAALLNKMKVEMMKTAFRRNLFIYAFLFYGRKSMPRVFQQ